MSLNATSRRKALRNLRSAFDLVHLRYAVAAADSGSFRQAAETLLIRQSTLSRCVRQLESSVGLTIFVRSSGGIRVVSRSLPCESKKISKSIPSNNAFRLFRANPLVSCMNWLTKFTAAPARHLPVGSGLLTEHRCDAPENTEAVKDVCADAEQIQIDGVQSKFVRNGRRIACRRLTRER
jgi:hypothetical protein